MTTAVRYAVVATVLASILCIWVSGSASGDEPRPNVFITAVNCVGDDNAVPTIESWNGSTPNSQPPEAAHEMVGQGVIRFAAYLPPGWNAVRVVGAHGCRANGTIVTLPGHVRRVLFTLSSTVFINDDDQSIAGEIPDVGLTVTRVTKSGGEIPASVQDGAFYFDHLKSASYTVRFRWMQGLYIDKQVNTSKLPVTILNLSLEDLASLRKE